MGLKMDTEALIEALESTGYVDLTLGQVGEYWHAGHAAVFGDFGLYREFIQAAYMTEDDGRRPAPVYVMQIQMKNTTVIDGPEHDNIEDAIHGGIIAACQAIRFHRAEIARTEGEK